MPNQAKIQKVDEVAERLSTAKSTALIQYQTLTAGEISNLRDKIKQTGGIMEVIKNSLIKRALAKNGLSLPQELTGPTSLIFCNDDEIAPLEEVEKVRQTKEKVDFKYGVYDKKLLSLDELKTLLSLPSKSTLISQFIGGLFNPLQRLAYALRFNQTQLVYTLKAIAEKQN